MSLWNTDKDCWREMNCEIFMKNKGLQVCKEKNHKIYICQSFLKYPTNTISFTGTGTISFYQAHQCRFFHFSIPPENRGRSSLQNVVGVFSLRQWIMLSAMTMITTFFISSCLNFTVLIAWLLPWLLASMHTHTVSVDM